MPVKTKITLCCLALCTGAAPLAAAGVRELALDCPRQETAESAGLCEALRQRLEAEGYQIVTRSDAALRLTLAVAPRGHAGLDASLAVRDASGHHDSGVLTLAVTDRGGIPPSAFPRLADALIERARLSLTRPSPD